MAGTAQSCTSRNRCFAPHCTYFAVRANSTGASPDDGHVLGVSASGEQRLEDSSIVDSISCYLRTSHYPDSKRFVLRQIYRSGLCSRTPHIGVLQKVVQVIWIKGFMLTLYRFFDCFHPHMPLFQQYLDPETTFANSPFLFWTLCIIGARPNSGADPHVYLQLVQELRVLLSQVFLQAHRSVDIVQALLLLCEFQLPSASLREDMVWTCGALAVRTATSLGLHRPPNAEDFTCRATFTRSQLEERTRVWLYCFIVDNA